MNIAAHDRELGTPWRWRVLAFLLAAVIGCYGVMHRDDAGPMSELEAVTLDWRFQIRGTRSAPAAIHLLLIDDETIRSFGGWPLRREIIAHTIDKLAAAGAAVVALDMLLEPISMPAGTDPHPGDVQLLEALDGNVPVILPMALSFTPDVLGDMRASESLRRHAFKIVLARTSPWKMREARQAVLPAEPFVEATHALGHVSLELAADGRLRADLPAICFDGDFYPSFSLAAVSALMGLSGDDVVLDLDHGVMLGSRPIPFDQDMRHHLNYYGGRGTIRSHSLMDLLQNRLPREVFAGRLVIIGGDAVAVGDRFVTPFSASLSGAEYLATSAANMVDGTSLHRGHLQTSIDLVVVLLVSAASAWIAGRVRPLTALGFVGCVMAALAIWCQLAFTSWYWWVSLVYPSAALMIAAATAQLALAAKNLRQTQRLSRDRAILARHFAPGIVDELLERDYRVQLDRAQHAVVMFVDLVGFTTLCEQLRPHEAIALLRHYHRLVEASVFQHHGMIANFAGDGVMCCFGLPETRPDAAGDALSAAQDLVKSVEAWCARASGNRLRPVGIGVGIHAGSVLLGNVGGDRQLQYTAIGDTVNIASRLQALTRELGVKVLASEQVIEETALGSSSGGTVDEFQNLGPIRLRGRHEPVAIFGWPTSASHPEDRRKEPDATVS